MPNAPHPPRPTLPLRIRFADLGDLVAEMTGRTLLLDVSSDTDQQLRAIADAADFLRTGELPGHWRRQRHLRTVPG